MSLGVSLRSDFPALDQTVGAERPLVYLDNAATTLKPRAVVDAVDHYYLQETANIHRGVHTLSQRATERYEQVREAVRGFINAKQEREIVFTSGTTAAINLVAQGFLRPRLQAGDEILITHMEHHSNIVPWQMLCEQTGAVLKVVPIDDRGQIKLADVADLLNERTRFVSVVYVSNSLGTINPVKEIVELAHRQDVPVLIDAAQAVASLPVDVQNLDCDFLAFSGHKLYGPTGVGVLYGKMDRLEETQPVQGGGDMILSVTFEKTTYNDIPTRFEAGTPHIAGVIGLGAAIDYVTALGMERIAAHEQQLMRYATERMREQPGVRIIGEAAQKTAIVSFVVADVHPHDIGTILDTEGVAIRAGHHCTQPVMARLGVPATARASFGIYNTQDDIDQLAAAVAKVREVFV
ncbi:cysteine desulfurase [Planctomycetota bacterium]